MSLRKYDEVIVERLRSDDEFRSAYWDEIITVIRNGETHVAEGMIHCIRTSYKPSKWMLNTGSNMTAKV